MLGLLEVDGYIYSWFWIGDHIFGIGPLICGLMNGAGGLIDGHEDPRLKPSEEVAVRRVNRHRLWYSDHMSV